MIGLNKGILKGTLEGILGKPGNELGATLKKGIPIDDPTHPV